MDSYILLEQMVPRINKSRKAFGNALQKSIFTGQIFLFAYMLFSFVGERKWIVRIQ
jgi:hypothetical protein